MKFAIDVPADEKDPFARFSMKRALQRLAGDSTLTKRRLRSESPLTMDSPIEKRGGRRVKKVNPKGGSVAPPKGDTKTSSALTLSRLKCKQLTSEVKRLNTQITKLNVEKGRAEGKVTKMSDMVKEKWETKVIAAHNNNFDLVMNELTQIRGMLKSILDKPVEVAKVPCLPSPLVPHLPQTSFFVREDSFPCSPTNRNQVGDQFGIRSERSSFINQGCDQGGRWIPSNRMGTSSASQKCSDNTPVRVTSSGGEPTKEVRGVVHTPVSEDSEDLPSKKRVRKKK